MRLDSGDLARLSADARHLLDEAGLGGVEIFASGSLDEHIVADLVAAGAPITGFGVGTRLGVSADHPYLDTAYKLSGYAGRARMKLSTGKANLPGRKQVYRVESGSPPQAAHDVIALDHEPIEARGLLVKVMEAGRRLPAGQADLPAIREHARRETARLPAALRTLDPADPPYRVQLSPGLEAELDRLRK